MTRVEACLCGGAIAAPSLAMSAPAVAAHNGTMAHRLWRMAAVDTRWIHPDLLAERLPAGTYHDPRCQRPTADDQPVDAVREGDIGASANGIEGLER
jgi:hypothetical protein